MTRKFRREQESPPAVGLADDSKQEASFWDNFSGSRENCFVIFSQHVHSFKVISLNSTSCQGKYQVNWR